jgi:hypothetical protein
MEIKCQLDATDGFFIADLIACSTCFGHNYAYHQELKSILQVVAACGIWCCKVGRCNILIEWYSCFLGIKYRVLYGFALRYVECRGGIYIYWHAPLH